MGLVSSSINVYIRDTRYIVESVLVVFFWFVPIFYPASIIPQRYQGIYMLNPVTEVVMGTRNILLEAKAPPTSSLINLVVVSLVMLAFGFGIFVRMQRRFYELL